MPRNNGFPCLRYLYLRCGRFIEAWSTLECPATTVALPVVTRVLNRAYIYLLHVHTYITIIHLL
ncbi:uncharacterized protein LACBIDRAFT_311392 [Laccaria bicolor S238N-H82]|uniref:Predicted protein n=1 Tax=Laccaria bicolor (strain S238N-H82 / ATCC MYA-4686) TaxID=486041 RepID=B0CZW9_LACBS|nr:uncharacterized protein LACBIDRAFT_311392 [Laccaria bicolor S238N-H82]EDR12692.1 predicted protein [Laccaria bicolor S238N-H82]|eukprot:XP_001876956.1 predicted protein [Laccaria bicolor S238N-H82]